MPPGMKSFWDTPGEAMRDMAAVHPRLVQHEPPADARGDRPLFERNEDGVKVFELETGVVRW
ncbi:hypothetical protein, partial [Enterobacter asburiae]